MKIPISAFILLVLLETGLERQSANAQSQAVLPGSNPYTIVNQDANSRVWQRQEYETGPDGVVVTNIHSYTELATGLNFLSNGQWTVSNEKIDILPNGLAAATNGQHQVYFPADISNGRIEMVTPDGRQVFSQPLELGYFDGSNAVVLAELTNSVGVLVGNNEVIYQNAFNGLKADLKYSYTLSGLEQDVIIHQQPMTPEYYGLNPDSARLQMITQFFTSPNPTALTTILPEQAGISLADESVGFGRMQMVLGRAFLTGNSASDPGALVAKSWLAVDGRQFLVEEVPVNAIAEALSSLPLTSMNERHSKASHLASHGLMPPKHQFGNKTTLKVAFTKGSLPTSGFVMDYQSINSGLTNYTFRGDTTYYISGTVYLYGTNTFEGGAVLKYTNSAILNCQSSPTIVSSAYRPVVFTSKDDDSVGDAISGSTSHPTNYYATDALLLPNNSNISLQHLRFEYAQTAIGIGGTLNLTNVQVVNCLYGVVGNSSQRLDLNLENVLMANVLTNVVFGNACPSGIITAQNVTFANSATNGSSIVGKYPINNWAINLTNCMLVNMQYKFKIGDYLNGDHNGSFPPNYIGNNYINSTVYPFTSVGAGNYYLTNGTPFRNVGTTNTDSALLELLVKGTTQPPLVLSNLISSSSTNLGPQVQRDTNAFPDLGYHYDVIDYLVDNYWITNCVLNLTNGVVIACCDDSGFIITDGGSVSSTGSPLTPNIVTSYQTVQEEPVAISMNGYGPGATEPLTLIM